MIGKHSSVPTRQSRPRALVRLQDGLRRQPPEHRDINLRDLRAFTERLNRPLRLRRRYFDVTLVDDPAITNLNRDFRGKAIPTDVLSFPFQDGPGPDSITEELGGFIGDIVISLDTAQHQAKSERHSLWVEVQQLVLHGALHLLGYDHETDDGEMNALELHLRRTLGIEGREKAERQKGRKTERQKDNSNSHE